MNLSTIFEAELTNEFKISKKAKIADIRARVSDLKLKRHNSSISTRAASTASQTSVEAKSDDFDEFSSIKTKENE